MHVAMMNPRLFALGLGALAATLGPCVAAEEAAVQVYECRQDGKVMFSGTPCTDPDGDPVVDPGPARQQTLELDYARPAAAQLQQARQAAAVAEYRADTVAEAALLDTEILNLEQRISNLQTERDARVSAVPPEQVESVTDSYNDTILAERARLGELQARRASLGPAAPPYGGRP